MTMQKNHLARKATAILSAVAVSSLLGLPAFAGSSMSSANKGGKQPQTQSNSDQMQCAPNTPQSNQSNQSTPPSTTAAPDASAPAASQLPNQSDPRAGIAPSDQTVTKSPGSPMTMSRVAKCPNGMMAPRKMKPSMRQAPGGSNSGNQMSPQQPTGNETRQSPADDNGSHSR